MKTILIIDDDEDIREIISYNLTKEGYTVLKAKNGVEGIKKAKKHNPGLILLDVMMPEMDGIEVCEILRADELTKDIKICFLTARSEDYSQIAGFDAGADDYVNKPVKPKVLSSRIKAILRRDSGANVIESNSNERIVINRDKYQLLIHGQPIHLPRKEFELLALLASKPGDVFEREVILQTVWGSEIVVGDRTIDVHIRKLREKIGNDSIKTVKGIGYKFTP
ncbi:MAG: response regulator transcription factor [Crocinitomicaceae bacterium]